MPFGLASAPQCFTKILATVAETGKVTGKPGPHLSPSPILQHTQKDLDLTIQMLLGHQFLVKYKKSHLVPVTRILHVGAFIDSMMGEVFLSLAWRTNIRELASCIHKNSTVPLATLSKLLGKMVSCIKIDPWARLHVRHLQWFLLPFQ